MSAHPMVAPQLRGHSELDLLRAIQKGYAYVDRTGRIVPTAIGASAYSDLVVADGAFFYATLNQTSGDDIDVVGGVHVVPGGGVVQNASGPFSGSGTAWTFDGSNDYASIAVNLSAYGAITLECWFQQATFTSDDGPLYEYTANYNSNTGFVLNPNNDGAKTYIGMHKAGGGGGYWDDKFLNPAAATWLHLQVYYSLTTPTTKTYLNGVLVSYSDTVLHSMSSGGTFDNSTLYLASRAGGSLFNDCSLAHLALYSGDVTGTADDHYAAATATAFGGFIIPNEGDAAFPDQAEPDAQDFVIIRQAFAKCGVVSGCEVTAQSSPNMTVAVASGTAKVDNSNVSVSAGNVTIDTADSQPRFDLIAVNAAGTKSAIKGTASSSPSFPTVPASRAILAAVYVAASDSAIDSNQIVDKRIILV